MTGRAGGAEVGRADERGAGTAGRALVEVQDLSKHFPIRRGLLRRTAGVVRAVDGVTFRIHAGETLGLVGESGSGKSTLGRTLLHLVSPTAGTVRVDGTPLSSLSAEELRRRRRDLQMVFQDPVASLDPRRTVGASVREPLDIHGIGDEAARRARVAHLLERVGLDPTWSRRYPHEFSGGQRQRIGIARALATEPRFIVADEPISALDVSIQAQIVNLLADLKDELGLTYLFIAHDLAMVRHLSDRVAVLYLGRIVELGPTATVFSAPLHPYTRALLSSIPVADPVLARRRLPTVRGEIPDPAAPPAGCAFHPRCPLATEVCRRETPELRTIGVESGTTPVEEPTARGRGATHPAGVTHEVACHHADVPASTG